MGNQAANQTMADFNEKYILQEYQSLRAEKLSRYDYANKLFSQFVTFSTTVWAAAFALFTLFEKLFQNSSASGAIILLGLLQVILFLFPALFSILVFNYSLRNSIRINLISDYLRQRIETINSQIPSKYTFHSWEGMKSKEQRFYFYKKKKESYRVGELWLTHSCFSWISLLISSIIIIEISRSFEQLQIDSGKFEKWFFSIILLQLFFNALHSILSFFFVWKPRQSEDNNENKVQTHNNQSAQSSQSSGSSQLSKGKTIDLIKLIKYLKPVVLIIFSIFLLCTSEGRIAIPFSSSIDLPQSLFWAVVIAYIILLYFTPPYKASLDEANETIHDNSDKVKEYLK